MVEAAYTGANAHPHQKAEPACLGRNKAIIAITRKLLIAVWPILTDQILDRHAEPEQLAPKLMQPVSSSLAIHERG
jgi:transposase